MPDSREFHEDQQTASEDRRFEQQQHEERCLAGLEPPAELRRSQTTNAAVLAAVRHFAGSLPLLISKPLFSDILLLCSGTNHL